MIPKIYTTKQAGEILGMAPKTVRALCSTGKLEAGMTESGEYRIEEKALEKYVKEILNRKPDIHPADK